MDRVEEQVVEEQKAMRMNIYSIISNRKGNIYNYFYSIRYSETLKSKIHL